ncbi:MAG: hypothetical protein IJS42_00405 [Synergistaceae bacterium]|nr:hypothetical protein [Synergistaceae bacterium]
MKKYVCDICGREIFKKNRIGGYTVCPKHMHQWFEHRRFLDNNPRTQNDLNEYRLREDGTVEFDCYDANSKVVGQFIIDREDLSKVRYHKWRIDSFDILPIPEGRGFWDLQTLHSEESLTGSPPMADAPAIFFAASSLLL